LSRNEDRGGAALLAALLRPELAAEDLDISRSRDTGRRGAPSRLRKLRS